MGYPSAMPENGPQHHLRYSARFLLRDLISFSMFPSLQFDHAISSARVEAVHAVVTLDHGVPTSIPAFA
jgi:hypothetical protein